MGPGEVMIALIVIGLPAITLFYGFHRFFKFREKQLEVDARLTAEASDLLYHLLVLLVARGVSLADIAHELASRRKG